MYKKIVHTEAKHSRRALMQKKKTIKYLMQILMQSLMKDERIHNEIKNLSLSRKRGRVL